MLALVIALGIQRPSADADSLRDTSIERLVADATIAPSENGGLVLLRITVNGHPATVLLDLGTNDFLILSTQALNHLKVEGDSIDSLGIGTNMELWVPVQAVDLNLGRIVPPPGFSPVVGLLGTRVLSHYDLLFDGPAHRVRIYVPPSHPPDALATHHATWFPPGITVSDCMPITIERQPEDHYVSFRLTVNGHPIPTIFDSGNDVTAINEPAAKIIGIHQSDPNVHLLPPDSAFSYPQVGPQLVYAVKGLTLHMGARTLSDHRVHLYQHIPSPDPNSPELDVGLDGFRDRLLWISYSGGQVCLSAPIPPASNKEKTR